MLTLYSREEMGQADYGWLKTRYHFSFANYYNPSRIHFGALRVINDDQIEAGSGFDPHSHKDMEIITYVRSGVLIHRDNLGHEGRTSAGEVQVMSAGTGITHAEYSDSTIDTLLFQIWIFPHTHNVSPRWEQRSFPKIAHENALPVLVSGDAQDQAAGALMIHQNARISGGLIAPEGKIHHPLASQAYVIVAQGPIQVGGIEMQTGDGLEAIDETHLDLVAGPTGAEILVIEVPHVA